MVEILVSITLFVLYLISNSFIYDTWTMPYDLCIFSFILGIFWGKRFSIKILTFGLLVSGLNFLGLFLQAKPNLETAQQRFEGVYSWWFFEVFKSIGWAILLVIIFSFIGLFAKKQIIRARRESASNR